MSSNFYNVLHRFSEPSSWGGIAGLLVAFGTPMGQANAIVQLGLALCSAAAIFIPEQGKGTDAVTTALAGVQAINSIKAAAADPALKGDVQAAQPTQAKVVGAYPVN